MIEKLSVWKWRMNIHTPGWHTFDFITFYPSLSPSGTGGIPGGGGLPGGGAASSGGGEPVPLRLQRVSRFFAVPLWHRRQPGVWFLLTIARCLSIAAFTYLCQGNSTPRFFSTRTLERGFLISCCDSSIATRENPSFGHFGHIQGKAHVGLFQLYPTSLPRPSCTHAENRQEIRCRFQNQDLAISSTIYDSVAFSRVLKACFVHSRGPLSQNLAT